MGPKCKGKCVDIQRRKRLHTIISIKNDVTFCMTNHVLNRWFTWSLWPPAQYVMSLGPDIKACEILCWVGWCKNSCLEFICTMSCGHLYLLWCIGIQLAQDEKIWVSWYRTQNWWPHNIWNTCLYILMLFLKSKGIIFAHLSNSNMIARQVACCTSLKRHTYSQTLSWMQSFQQDPIFLWKYT